MPAARHSPSCRSSGHTPVEVADRGAEETADLVPARREQPSGNGQSDPDVEVPRAAARRRAGRRTRARRRAAGADDAGELRERRARVVDVAEEVREREVVERPVGEWDCGRRGLDQWNASAEASPRGARASRRSGRALSPRVRARAAVRRRALCPWRRRAPSRRRSAPARRGAAPAWVLTEREHGADAVVVAAERREEATRVQLPLGHARTLPYPCARVADATTSSAPLPRPPRSPRTERR